LLRGDSELPFPQPPNENQPNADSDIVRLTRDDNGAREVMNWNATKSLDCSSLYFKRRCIQELTLFP